MKTLRNNSFELFGPYIFLKRLAQGGMAEVFLSRPNSLDANGRVQVVKRILPHVSSNSAFLNMFQREIRIIMGFNHPHIVQLHDFGNFAGQPFIAMEYIEGKSVKDIILRYQDMKMKVPTPVVLSLISQAASGLSYAHEFSNKVTGEELNAVHRDISPHNLIVSYDGNLKVIDFGIAKATCNIVDLTQAGVFKGKAAYFSPEQLSGANIDARTDIFSLGIVLWEMLTGERLFAKEGDNDITTMSKVKSCERYIVPPSTIDSSIPKDIDEIVLTALAKDPWDRFETAKEFQTALRAAMIQHYPHFSYVNVGEFMSEVFSEDIQKDQKLLRELNEDVQKTLAGSKNDSTQIISSNTNVTSIQQVSTMAQTSDSGAYHDTGTTNMDVRLNNIEKLIRQKATGRHYVMLVVYIITLVYLKLNEDWDFGLSKEALASEMTQTYPVAPNTALRKNKAHASRLPAQSNLNTNSITPNATLTEAQKAYAERFPKQKVVTKFTQAESKSTRNYKTRGNNIKQKAVKQKTAKRTTSKVTKRKASVQNENRNRKHFVTTSNE